MPPCLCVRFGPFRQEALNEPGISLSAAWAALAVPIVVFYILKIRLRQVPVSTTIFWQQIYDEKRPRSLWQILRHLISLLMQISGCCCSFSL